VGIQVPSSIGQGVEAERLVVTDIGECGVGSPVQSLHRQEEGCGV